MENVKTASGTELNNDLINKVLESTENKSEQVEVTSPSDTFVTLPGGFITATGEVIKTAEVRELNGKDEEYIGKSGSISRAFNVVLNRAVVKIGDLPVDEKLMDSLLSGDRDSLMLGIFKATFGAEAEIAAYCGGCEDFKTVAVDIDRDINYKVLVDSVEDRTFTVHGKAKTYLVTLPTGVVQKELANNQDKTQAELTTTLLEYCILEIDDKPVIGKAQVQNIGLVDRRKISSEISNRIPGPQLSDIEVDCPECSGKVVVPFNLGALFQF